jgi:hypothetical protein
VVLDDVPLREHLESKIDSLAELVRLEMKLLAEDRERQRHDLAERLEGMNALRAQLDKQAATFVTRERVENLERATWRALGILGGMILIIQVIVSILLKG